MQISPIVAQPVNLHAELTRVFHRELTHQRFMFRGSGWGQGMCDLLLFPGCCGRAGLEAEAVVPGLQDVASVGEAVEERGGHLGVTEDGGTFAEAEVRGDDDAGALVELAQEVEEQRAAGCAERQVAQLIQDHEIKPCQAFGDLAGLTLCFLLLQGIHQFDG